MAADDALQKYFASLPARIKRDLGKALDDAAHGLASAIREAAPFESGSLSGSIEVRPGSHELERVVTAGGEATTRPVREGASVEYDYALALEFGTSHQNARPFFYPTYREQASGIRRNLAKKLSEALK